MDECQLRLAGECHAEGVGIGALVSQAKVSRMKNFSEKDVLHVVTLLARRDLVLPDGVLVDSDLGVLAIEEGAISVHRLAKSVESRIQERPSLDANSAAFLSIEA